MPEAEVVESGGKFHRTEFRFTLHEGESRLDFIQTHLMFDHAASYLTHSKVTKFGADPEQDIQSAKDVLYERLPKDIADNLVSAFLDRRMGAKVVFKAKKPRDETRGLKSIKFVEPKKEAV